MSENSTAGKERQQAVETLQELVKGIHVAMLTTADGDDLRSRPMITANHKFDGELWFFTLAQDPKVAEIQQHPAVNVAYADPDANRYVSISGKAELVRSQKKSELLWTDELSQWFPAGPTDPDLALLRVDAQEAEYWDLKADGLAGAVKGLIFGSDPKRKHEKIDWSASSSQS